MSIYFDTIPNEITSIILYYIGRRSYFSFIECLGNNKGVIIKQCVNYFYPILFNHYMDLYEYYQSIYIYFIIKWYYQYLLKILNKRKLAVHNNIIWIFFWIQKSIITREDHYNRESIPYNRPIYKCKDDSNCVNPSLLCELLFKLTFSKSYIKLQDKRDEISWVSLYPNIILILYDLNIYGVYNKHHLEDFSYTAKGELNDDLLRKVTERLITSKLQHYKELKELINE